MSYTTVLANIHDFTIVSPPDLPWDERDSLSQHLVFSMYVKQLYKFGSSVIEGIYARKRNDRRLLTNKMLRFIVRTIRRFARFEVLRSSLEGLLFEQVAYLNVPFEIPFMLKGIENEINLTCVYFNTAAWEIAMDEGELDFSKSEEISDKDIAHLLVYFGMLDYMIKEIRAYLLKSVRGHNFWKWKQRALRYMNSVQKSSRFASGSLLEFLKNKNADADADVDADADADVNTGDD